VTTGEKMPGEQTMNTDRSPRVLQVLGGPGGGWGGAGVVVMAITKELLSRGGAVWAHCLSDETIERFESAGANVVTSTLWRRSIHPVFDLLALAELYRLCRRERFDIVNTHTSKGGILGRIAARLAGVPHVVHTVHGYAFNEVDSRAKAIVYTWLERLASPFCDVIISVNEEERLIAIEKKITSPEKITTVLNGIDTSVFRDVGPVDNLRRELDPGGDAVLIGSTGRLAPQKGFEYAVRAMPAIVDAYPQTRLVIAGDGPLEADLKALARQMGVADHCLFLGFRPDVPELLACYDIFVLPSLWEGLSISLLEAMAAGKAIVTTAIKGNREVIDDGVDGVLVPPADPDVLAGALIDLIGDRECIVMLGENARRKAVEEFSQEAMVARTLELYGLPRADAGAHERLTSDGGLLRRANALSEER
jgi:glycosyltransferase involved in cell wall biosynthesis